MEGLEQNVKDQLERLLNQLEDLEALRDEMSADEYERERQDTRTQLNEFQESLAKMTSGNLTLQSEFEATRLAVRAAISEAFKTPQVIRLFAQKQPAALRRRLAEIDRDVKLGKHAKEAVAEEVTEILTALSKLGEQLSTGEESFLEANRTKLLSDFEAVDESADVGAAPVDGSLLPTESTSPRDTMYKKG